MVARGVARFVMVITMLNEVVVILVTMVIIVAFMSVAKSTFIRNRNCLTYEPYEIRLQPCQLT